MVSLLWPVVQLDERPRLEQRLRKRVLSAACSLWHWGRHGISLSCSFYVCQTGVGFTLVLCEEGSRV